MAPAKDWTRSIPSSTSPSPLPKDGPRLLRVLVVAMGYVLSKVYHPLSRLPCAHICRLTSGWARRLAWSSCSVPFGYGGIVKLLTPNDRRSMLRLFQVIFLWGN
ncbi:hypothetical protein ARMSODRAFT_967312 [Armillaria solidipes]|uniref:Uncharacterized protein n=1 Tax=Armillaria solidipes TaxID=1076256 RepID=A0A2H3AJ43_9AGAR|nr:hypothetical protein ARMSODRAFT_967312 [Armillaria solidipes]